MKSDRSETAAAAPRAPRAFTLIEMLTVIAIIGILAGILLPVVHKVRQAARVAQTKSDISTLAQGLNAYNMDFGAFPPDSNTCLSPDEPLSFFKNLDSPNECLLWFLTRTYTRDTTAAGYPLRTPAWTAANSSTVYARAAGGPYFDPKAKQTRDYDQDGFLEFVDPWGRPYMYRAYLRPCMVSKIELQTASPPAPVAVYRVTIDATDLNEENLRGLVRGIGRVKISGSGAGNNGTFDIGDTSAVAVSPPWFDISNAAGAAENSSGSLQLYARFVLHNPQTFDLYSLGPNGVTRACTRPRNFSEPDPDKQMTPWQPQNSYAPLHAEMQKWKQVWGTPGDGNDVGVDQGGNLVNDDNDRDDISNW